MQFCCRRLPYLLLLWLGFTLAVKAQPLSSAQALAAAINQFNIATAGEQVFVHTDKPQYTTTDTIWLKAYLLNTRLEGSTKSGLLYIELLNDTGRLAIRQCLPIQNGVTLGQIALTPAGSQPLSAGSYTLRAYTIWMQNQGEGSLFTRRLQISTAADPWLVQVVQQGSNPEPLQPTLRLTNAADSEPLRLQSMQVTLTQNGRAVAHQTLQTNLGGEITPTFKAPPASGRNALQLVIQPAGPAGGTRQLFVPLTMGQQDPDVQFLPEGGTLVAGLTGIVGFKAVGPGGKGIEVKGTITDEAGGQVATFASAHLGMGAFRLRPEAGHQYTAHATLPSGRVVNYTLPQAKPEGIALHIDNNPGADSDSLTFTVQATPGEATQQRYLLIAQAGGQVVYSARVSFNGRPATGSIAQSVFPVGIARFTLFTESRQPLAERLVYIHHSHALTQLRVAAGRDTVNRPGHPLALQMTLTDEQGQPLPANLSLAVTDDATIKADSTNVPDIRSYMLLTSQVTGIIEQPGYYFDTTSHNRLAALDVLLLTQGWRGYDWKSVFAPAFQPAFAAEQAFQASGHLRRTAGKSLAGLPVMLLSTRKPLLALDTLSDANGRFNFRHLPPYDTASFMVQVKDKRGKMFEATVEMDEFVPAKVNQLPRSSEMPWYVNADTVQRSFARRGAVRAGLDQDEAYGRGTRLKAVVIKGKRIVKGSQNLNGPGMADQLLDEADLKKAGKMRLMDLLYSRIKGFRPYMIYEKPVKFVVDGVNIDFFFQPNSDSSNYIDFVQRHIDVLNAEDIKGIEVLYSGQYNSKYVMRYNPEILVTPGSLFPAYIEITTWSGNGLFQRRKSGNYLYTPVPISWPKTFYQPKYTTPQETRLADLRSTILWEPYLVTDNKGKAGISFTTKSKPGRYTLIVQGADLNGALIYHRQHISVPPK